MCQLFGFICPPGCKCFQLAILCVTAEARPLEEAETFHMLYYLQSCNLSSLQKLNIDQDQIIMFIAPNNLLKEDSICLSVSHWTSLAKFDATYNQINTVESDCFSSLQFVKLIVLKNNSINVLFMRVFSNLTNLSLVDLSFNEIDYLQKYSFRNVTCQYILLLQGNDIFETHIDADIFNSVYPSFVFSDNKVVCCLVSTDTKCISDDTLHTPSCSKLLPQASLKGIFFLMSVILTIFACLSLFFTQKQRVLERKKLKIAKTQPTGKLAYLTICLYFTISDVFLILYCSIILFSDTYFEKVFLSTEMWEQSNLCSVAFVAISMYFCVLPFLVVVISCVRFSVIKYPHNSRFKSSKNSVLIFIASVVCLCLTTCCLTVILTGPGNMLCFPLVLTSSSFLPILVAVIQVVCLISEVILSQITVRCACDQPLPLPGSTKQVHKSSLVLHFALLNASHFVSWIPSLLVFILSCLLTKDPGPVVLWTVSTTLPTASLVSPVLYLWQDLKRHFNCQFLVKTESRAVL